MYKGEVFRKISFRYAPIYLFYQKWCNGGRQVKKGRNYWAAITLVHKRSYFLYLFILSNYFSLCIDKILEMFQVTFFACTELNLIGHVY